MKTGRILWFGCILCFGVMAKAASAPDWFEPYLREDVSALRGPDGAVQLLDEEIVRYVAPTQIRKVIRGGVRVYSAEGRRWATAAYSFNADSERIIDLRAWIISANGKKVQKCGREGFSSVVAQYSAYFWNAERFVTYTGASEVEVGGVLVWELEFESQTGILENSYSFRNQLPLANGLFEVIPWNGEQLVWFATSKSIPAPEPGRAPNALRWHYRPPPPSREIPPPGFLPDALMVSARCVFKQQPELSVPDWATLARRLDEVVAPRVAVTPEISACATRLTAGKTGRWERIRALTEFVQHDIYYISVTLDKDYLAGCRPHPAAEVLASRNGDCKDKVTLLCALLRSIGEESRMVLANSGNPRAISPEWPAMGFNHAIIALRADEAVPVGWPVVTSASMGRMVLFDPTDSVTPLGFLPTSDQGGYALILGGNEAVYLPFEDSARTPVERHMIATLDPAGTVLVKVQEKLGGSVAVAEYQRHEHANREKFAHALEASVHRELPLAREIRGSSTWDGPAANLGIDFSFTAEKFARPFGPDGLMFSPASLHVPVVLPEWTTTDEGLVRISAAHEVWEARFVFPEGVALDELPSEFTLEIPGYACRLTYQKEAEGVVFRCNYQQSAGLLEKDKYEMLRQSMRKTNEALRRPVLLRRTVAVKQSV